MLLYQALAYTIHEYIQKSQAKTIHFTCQLQHGIINLSYLMDHILYQILKIILSILSENMKQ